MNRLVRWLGKLSVARKFQLVGALALAAALVPAFLTLRAALSTARLADSEVSGSIIAEDVLCGLFKAQEAGAQARLAAQGLGGSERTAAIAAAQAAFAKVAELTREDPRFAGSARAAADANRAWAEAAGAISAAQPDRDQVDAALAGTTAAAMALLDRVRDESGYTYTPYVDTYHLMFVALTLAPEGSVMLAELKQLALDTDPAGAAVIEARARDVLRNSERLKSELAKAMAVDPAEREHLVAAMQDYASSIERIVGAIGNGATGSELPQMFDAVEPLQHALSEALLAQLRKNSESHGSEATNTTRALSAGLLAAVGLLIGILVVVGRSVARSVNVAVTAAQRIAGLQLDEPIHAQGEDELGVLLRALDRMRLDLRERIEREAAIAAENARVRRALDVTSSGVMIADTDGRILYMNQAVLRTLREAEGDMRTRFPWFSADKVLGSSFDQFHMDPSKQRNLIAGLKATHHARIRVGEKAFELAASPIHEDGRRIGTVLEWLDRSAESEFRHGLRNVAQRAQAGMLDARVEVKVQDPRFVELAEIFNGLIGTTAKAIEEVGVVMGGLSQGNLGIRSDALLLGKFGELNDAANRTAKSLAEVIGQLQKTIGQINSAASEIAEGNNDLSQRTEQAAASIEETAAALHEVNSTVAQSADNAREAKILAGRAAEIAAEGGAVVSQVVSTMKAIQESSKKMSDIISVIDGIAFQTNILALNAAVEAARAGEQGRGFAVVASEVRALAQRSADAAKEIAGLIRGSDQRVQSGSELVRRAGEQMEQIVGSAQQVADIVADISAASAEQARGISEVNTAVEAMDQATQANAALVEQIAAAAQSMSQEAARLNELSARFVIDRDAGARVSGFADMVKAHQAWKFKLREVIDGRARESYDPKVVGVDNACALGQWLYAEGRRHAHTPEYRALQKHHAEFHRCAARVLELDARGDKAGAEHLLNEDFAELSETTIQAISRLRERVK